MKRIASTLMVILTFALVFPAGAFAQNAITVQNASGDPGDNGVVVRIELANNTDVGGFQFTLTDETGDLTPQSVRAGTRLSGLFTVSDHIVNDVDGNIGKDEVRILGVSLDTQNQQTLSAGSGVIAEVLYNVANGATGPYNLTLSGVVLSDPTASEISPVTTTPPGVFSIVQTSPTTLSFENAKTAISVGENGNVTINMDNSQLTGARGVAGIEFTLVDNSPSSTPIEYVDNSASAVGRAASAGFSASANETSEGLKVTITNFGGVPLPDGTGAIATLQIHRVSPGTVPIAFSNVIFADGDAVALPQGTHTGTQIVTNEVPTLADISDPPAVDENAGEQTVNLSGITAGGGENQELAVTASSDNTALILDFLVTYTSGDLTGSVAYTPLANANGTAIVTVTVTDPGLDGTLRTDDDRSVQKTFTVTVNGANEAPTLADIEDPPAVDEDAGAQTVNLSGITAGEGETQALTVTATSSNPALIANPVVTYTSANPTGFLAYTPLSNASGTAIITVTVTDAGLDDTPDNVDDRSVQKTFTVTVNAVNDSPTLADIEDPPAVDEDALEQTVNLSGIAAGGGESQALTVTATSSNPALIANPVVTYTSGDLTGSLVYTPVGDASGAAIVTVKVTDAGLDDKPGSLDDGTVQKTFTVTVNAVNDGPSITAPAQVSIIEDEAVTFSGGNLISVDDIDAGSGVIQVTLTANSAVTLQTTSGVTGNGTNRVIITGALSAVNSALENLVYTPTLNNDVSGSLKIDVTDQGNTGSGGPRTASHKVNIGITPVNDSPAITNPVSDIFAEENKAFSFAVDPVGRLGGTAIDPENDPVVFSQDGKPSWLKFNTVTGVFSGTAPEGTAGTHTISVSVTETTTDPPLSSSKDFTLTVNEDATNPSFTRFPIVQEISDHSAVFLWVANEEVKGKAETVILNQQIGERRVLSIQDNPAETTEFKKKDRVTVDGLTADSLYHATVTIIDRRGNFVVSKPLIFKTRVAPDITPPIFNILPVLVNRKQHSLTYKWTANEASKATLTITHKNGAALDTVLTFATADFSEKGEISATGLDDDTLYKGQFSLEDAKGNAPPTAGEGGSLTNNPASVEDRTRRLPDVKSPVATTEPVAEVSNTTANILYSTNEDATTVIEYGESAALGLTFTSADFVRDHNVRLTGLKAGTKFSFRLGAAVDRSGNAMTPTALQSFKTKQNPDTAGPLFNRGPAVISVTDVAAVLRWTNNELASFALEVTEKDTTNTTRTASGDLELTRTITVPDLKPDTQYDYSLTATDAAGNSSAVRTGKFRTKKAVDTIAPRITGALTFTADASRIRAVWVTDEASDSRGKIYFGPGIGDLVDVVNDPNSATDHALTFTGLQPDTTYTIKISSFDANGNEAKSEGAKRTRLAPDVTPPTPTGITATADVGRALIKWVTSEPANSRVFFSTTRSDLDGDASAAQAVTLAGLVTRHAVALTELGTSAQKYFYKVQSRDAAENRSFPLPDFARSFTTLAVEPKLSVTGGTLSGDAASTTTAIVLWNTNVPSTSRVLFGIRPTDNSPVDLDNSVEDDNLVTIHTATLTGLDAGTTYQFKVSSTNASGSQTSVVPGAGKAFPEFTTKEIVDALKPLLIERPSREYKADKKVILRWKTDEKATSSVYYREAGQVNFQRQDAIPLTANITNHLISIEELNPGTSYDFVIESADAEGNTLRFPAGAVVTRLASGLFKITGISQVGLGSFVTNDGPDEQAPVILSGPIVTGTNTDAVTLNWTTDELSTSTVNFGEGNTTDQQVENGTLVTTHTVTVTGLSASTVYSYAVSSVDPSNNGPTTSAAAVVQTSAQADVTPPVISNISTSSTFVSSADGASATITWDTDESSDTQVEFGTTVALGQTKTQSESVTGHSMTITRLTPSTPYSYRVASTDVSGNGPSLSSTATFTTANAAADTSLPTFSNIKTDGTTDTKVEVAWDTNENASSILLVINAAGDTSRVESGTQTSTHTLSVTDAAFISASTAYTVVVQGEDNSGNLGTSSGTVVTTEAGPDVTAPSAPTGLTAAAGNAEVKLDWTAVSATDLAGYNVFKDSSQVASNVTENTYTATGLTNGTLVTFEVRAIDQTGNESTANPTTTATPALTLAPSAPPNLGTFEGGVEVTTVSLKPFLVVGNVTPVDGRATPVYTFTVYTDAGLTNLVTSISGITEGTSTNPTHWQITDPTLTDGIVLLDATTYHWRSRANDGVTDGPWSATKTFTTSASKPTAVQLAGFTAESDRGIVDIGWQTYSNLGLRGFHVYRSLNPGGPFELISGDALIAATEAEYVFQDRDVTINVTYYYQVEAINQDEASQRFGPITVKVSPPNRFTLDQNFPNPFNPVTSIRYELAVAGQVQLMVYNLLGQQVVTLVESRQQAGFHTVTWNGLNSSHRSVASGVYFYRIVVTGDDKNTFTSSKKMLLLK